jgi:aspartate ammonia-lyase
VLALLTSIKNQLDIDLQQMYFAYAHFEGALKEVSVTVLREKCAKKLRVHRSNPGANIASIIT